MYVDKNTLFSDQQSVSATATSDIVDLYPGYSGGDRPFILALASDFQGTGSVEIQLESAADASFTSSRRVASFPVRASELAAGGEVLAISLPRNVERYVRLKYVVRGTITSLKLSAMLALDI